jgi:hypothetical protein
MLSEKQKQKNWAGRVVQAVEALNSNPSVALKKKKALL